MGDRCYVQFHLTGPIQKVEHLAVIRDIFDKWGVRPESSSFENSVLYADGVGFASFYREEVNYGNTDEIETLLAKIKCGYVINQGAGGEYGAQDRAYWPEFGYFEHDTNGDEPTMTVTEIRKAMETGELEVAIKELVENAERASGKNMPHLSLSKEVRDYLEGKMAEASLPDIVRFPEADWRRGVTAGDTRLGYAEWVQHQKEAASAT